MCPLWVWTSSALVPGHRAAGVSPGLHTITTTVWEMGVCLAASLLGLSRVGQHCRFRFKHLKVVFKHFGFGRTLTCVWPAFAHPSSNPCVFQGKFNPYVSDTFTLNSSKYCFVKTTGCPGLLRSSFNGSFLKLFFLRNRKSNVCQKLKRT